MGVVANLLARVLLLYLNRMEPASERRYLCTIPTRKILEARGNKCLQKPVLRNQDQGRIAYYIGSYLSLLLMDPCRFIDAVAWRLAGESLAKVAWRSQAPP